MTDASPTPAPAVRALPVPLQKDEALLLLVRRHWLYFSLRMAGVAAAGLGGTALAILVVVETFGFDGTPGRIAMAGIAAWALYWLIRGYFTWYRYQNDVWVVTNQRILDSIRRHWFHHQMSSADLVDVEDINVAREGILATAFNFGDVRCQTAGEVPNFILSGIPEPAKVLGTIDAARDAARRALRSPY